MRKVVLLLWIAGAYAFSPVARPILSNSRRTSSLSIHNTIFEGEATPYAQSINHREIISQSPLTNLDGQQVYFDDVVRERTSIVVFLRSLG